eukprot:TRINITY_DN14568_c0_g1_i1.p1 TRINITY_DN14568_c0_g1~~TRINITY_DN14568_c0_g1_i1.p1  ORF type:complete len:372 (-),score=50.58 TRINITY_DN14568_c0_g1_i1:55-1170(-)
MIVMGCRSSGMAGTGELSEEVESAAAEEDIVVEFSGKSAMLLAEKLVLSSFSCLDKQTIVDMTLNDGSLTALVFDGTDGLQRDQTYTWDTGKLPWGEATDDAIINPTAHDNAYKRMFTTLHGGVWCSGHVRNRLCNLQGAEMRLDRGTMPDNFDEMSPLSELAISEDSGLSESLHRVSATVGYDLPDQLTVYAGWSSGLVTSETYDLSGWSLSGGSAPAIGTASSYYQAHNEGVNCLAWVYKGSALFTAGGDGTARGWRVRSGDLSQMEQFVCFRGHYQYHEVTCIDATEKLVLTGSTDQTAQLWDWCGVKLRMFIGGHDACLNSVSLEVNEQHGITIASSDPVKLNLWSLEQWSEAVSYTHLTLPTKRIV